MARFEPEGFVLTIDPARAPTLLREHARRDPEPCASEPAVDEDSPTVRLPCAHELV